MGLYDKYILPKITHFTCSRKPNMRQREKVVPLAKGRVLEVGIGTGLNLPFYDTDKVQHVWGLEPSVEMWAIAQQKSVRKWQNRLNPVWKKLGGGCNLNRDIPSLLTQAGFTIRDMETMYLPGWRPASFNYWGSAS